jgi:hypothetical protein
MKSISGKIVEKKLDNIHKIILDKQFNIFSYLNDSNMKN